MNCPDCKIEMEVIDQYEYEVYKCPKCGIEVESEECEGWNGYASAKEDLEAL